ncbi:hypothetical protein J6590_038869 [Homalodisca vitripennis]|nr:hypothetical protein J6590_038869 [Homalodisca vitripennis]
MKILGDPLDPLAGCVLESSFTDHTHMMVFPCFLYGDSILRVDIDGIQKVQRLLSVVFTIHVNKTTNLPIEGCRPVLSLQEPRYAVQGDRGEVADRRTRQDDQFDSLE